jgi:hypothetical protein
MDNPDSSILAIVKKATEDIEMMTTDVIIGTCAPHRKESQLSVVLFVDNAQAVGTAGSIA